MWTLAEEGPVSTKYQRFQDSGLLVQNRGGQKELTQPFLVPGKNKCEP